jgi:mono/diheme cytochrome c family protein
MVRRNVLIMLALAGAIAACSPKPPGAPQAGASASTAATPSAGAGAPAAGAASSAADVGARIYGGNCVPCHQQTGVGIPGVYPSLVGSPVVQGDPAELARWVIKGQRPHSLPAGRYATQMLQFGWMKPADAAALFTYLRSNFGNTAAPVDAAAVAQALGP